MSRLARISLSLLGLTAMLIAAGCSSHGRPATATAAPSPAAAPRAEAPADASHFRLPDYRQVRLDNGLTLMLMEQHEVPLIAVDVSLPGGALADHGRSGLAGLTAESLLFGTAELTREELDRQLDFIGARVRSSANKEFNRLSASFAAGDTDLMLPLLADILLRPAFDAAEFDRYQERRLAELTQQKESPRRVIGNYFDKLVFGRHPYAAVADGEAGTVAAVTVDDVRDFHRRWYVPAGAVIAVVGDFETTALQRELTALFGDWTGRPAEQVRMPDPTPPDHSRVLLVDKADARESTFYIGGLGIPRSHPDYVAIQVVNTVLGGRFTSWLNDELRVNAGLTYGASSSFAPYRRGGSFHIGSFTPTATTSEALDLAVTTYDRLWKQGIDEQTLASAKAYVKGQFPLEYETSGQLARLLVEMHDYGFDESFIDEFEDRVDRLTVDEARRVIDAVFPRENLQFVVVGQAAAIRDQVARYGELIEVDIMQEGFDF